MKKIGFFLSVIIIFTFAITSYALGNECVKNDIPVDVKVAADEGLKTLVQMVSSNPDKFEFTSDELDNIKVKIGYNVFVIDKDKFIKEDKLEKMLYKTDMWEFVVECNGHPKTFLTVGFEDGKYRMVHFGGNSKYFVDKITEYNNLEHYKLIKVRGNYFVFDEGKNSQVLPCFNINSTNSELFSNEILTKNKKITSKEFVEILKQKQNKGNDLEYGN